MRKFRTAVLLLILVATLSSYVWADSADPVKVYTKKITFNKTSRTANVVDVDLKDEM